MLYILIKYLKLFFLQIHIYNATGYIILGITPFRPGTQYFQAWNTSVTLAVTIEFIQ